MLFEIPVDCLCEITSYLDSKRDFLSFALLSKFSHELIVSSESFLFRNLYFPIHVNLHEDNGRSNIIVPPFSQKLDIVFKYFDGQIKKKNETGLHYQLKKLFNKVPESKGANDRLLYFQGILHKEITQLILSSRLTGLRISVRIKIKEVDMPTGESNPTIIPITEGRRIYSNIVKFIDRIFDIEKFPFGRIEDFGLDILVSCVPFFRRDKHSFFLGEGKQKVAVNLGCHLRKMTSLRSLELHAKVYHKRGLVAREDFPCIILTPNDVRPLQNLQRVNISLRSLTSGLLRSCILSAPATISTLFIDEEPLGFNPLELFFEEVDTDTCVIRRLYWRIRDETTYYSRPKSGVVNLEFVKKFPNLKVLQMRDGDGDNVAVFKMTDTVANTNKEEVIAEGEGEREDQNSVDVIMKNTIAVQSLAREVEKKNNTSGDTSEKVDSSTSQTGGSEVKLDEKKFPLLVEYSEFKNFVSHGLVLEELTTPYYTLTKPFRTLIGGDLKKLCLVHSYVPDEFSGEWFKEFHNLQEIGVKDEQSRTIKFSDCDCFLEFLPKLEVVRTSSCNTYSCLANRNVFEYMKKNNIQLRGFRCCENFRGDDINPEGMQVLGHENCTKRVIACKKCFSRWKESIPEAFSCKDCSELICKHCARQCSSPHKKWGKRSIKLTCDKCAQFCDYCPKSFCNKCIKDHEFGCALRDGCNLM